AGCGASPGRVAERGPRSVGRCSFHGRGGRLGARAGVVVRGRMAIGVCVALGRAGAAGASAERDDGELAAPAPSRRVGQGDGRTDGRRGNTRGDRRPRVLGRGGGSRVPASLRGFVRRRLPSPRASCAGRVARGGAGAVKNLQLAATLNEIADLLEILGENPFRIRAYRRAARSIELLPESIETVWREGRLQEIEGVGKGLAAGIEQWLAEGVMDAHEELKRRIPRGLLEVVRVPGVGPKTAKLLYDALGVQSLADLEEACRAGRVRTIKGLGPKTEENILRGIERLRRFAARTPIGVALPLAQGIVAELAALPAVRRAAYA